MDVRSMPTSALVVNLTLNSGVFTKDEYQAIADELNRRVPPSARPQPAGRDGFRLCYVRSGFAWFAAVDDVTKVWDDDWNDAPYEHNAGTPYEWLYGAEIQKDDPRRKTQSHEVIPIEIVKVAYEGRFYEPCDGSGNSSFTVEDINAGRVAWLHCRDPLVNIYAGVTLSEFRQLIGKAGRVLE